MERIAQKPYSTHPDDKDTLVVLSRNHKGEYVTHLYNRENAGHSDGHYFKGYDAALADYNKRGEI